MDSLPIRFGILTVSDRCSAGEAEDKSGPTLEAAIKNCKHFAGIVCRKACVPDNVLDICEKLVCWSDSSAGCCDVILTTGGTGFSVRDITPEATLKVITKRCDSFAMMGTVRSSSPFAFLSRAVSGIREKTLIVNLPGSTRGVTECFEIMAPVLPHAVHLIVGNVEAVSHAHSICHTDFHHSVHKMYHHHHHHHSMAGEHHHNINDLTALYSKLDHSPTTSSVREIKSGLRPRESQWPMISLAQAQATVLEVAGRVTPQLVHVPLMESLGRIGGDCSSAVNLPPFRASVKDGYAVKVSDGVSPRTVVSASSAGDQMKDSVLKDGECVRVNTGAPIPSGADAVIQVEDTRVLDMNEQSEEVNIEILKAPKLGQDIREIGSDMTLGSIIMRNGDKIGSSCLGILASSGIHNVPCWSVRVCVFSTGDELCNIGQELPSGKIYDSNRHTLLSLLKENSFPSTDGGIIRDEPDEIFRRLLKELKNHDVLITTGSVSMGDKDYLKLVLESDLKAKILFGRIDLKPGKPTTFADVVTEDGKQKLIFSLPGNPVSAAVTCHLLVLPALRRITNNPMLFSPTIKVQVSEKVMFDDTRKEFKRAVVRYNSSGLPVASLCGGQASSRLGSMMEANALITCDPGTILSEGSTLDAHMIGQFRF